MTVGTSGISSTKSATAQTMFVKAARAEPKKGGSAKFGLAHGATTDSLDPATYPDQFTGTMGWGATGNSLTAFTTGGRYVWRVRTGGYVYSSPAVWGGRVFFGSYDGRLYSVIDSLAVIGLLAQIKKSALCAPTAPVLVVCQP